VDIWWQRHGVFEQTGKNWRWACVVNVEALATGINMMWVLIASFLIFFMKAGFAMLEAGQVRAKNVSNQLTQSLLTLCVGLLTFFALGEAVARGVGLATGGDVGQLFGYLGSGDLTTAVPLLMAGMFAIAAANIVSGGVAGRCKPRMYVVYTLFITAVVYPIAVGLTWKGGFLSQLGFTEFAGGMVIHGMGGLSGLTAAYVLGPRIGRFGDDGSPNVIPGHSVTLAVLGTLILAFGWYGFNVGTAATVFADEGSLSLSSFAAAGRVAIVTSLGMVAGGLAAGIVAWKKTGKVDTLYLANGILAGLVGVTGAANVLTWGGALFLGALAGAQLPIVFDFVENHLRIDDVCAVFPVHGSAGILGIVLYPLPFVSTVGFDPGQIAVQLLGVLVIGTTSVVGTYGLFKVAMAIDWARVTADNERSGLDGSAHGVETYPEFASPDGITNSGIRTDGGRANDIELVMAIVRPEALTDVKQALAEVGAPSLTVSDVSGRGSQDPKTGQWRGEQYTVDLHRKVKIECVVSEVPAQEVAAAIRDAAHTGEKGDGKVFILPVEDALQVRTDRRGREAV